MRSSRKLRRQTRKGGGISRLLFVDFKPFVEVPTPVRLLHGKDIGVVLREVRRAYLDLDYVFALRQRRQRYPESIGYPGVVTLWFQ
jgi:hypothetical protein